MTKLDVDQIHKIAFDEYQRAGHVTLSGEIARELFTNIPNREKQLEEVNAALHRRNDRLAAERDALLAYYRAAEAYENDPDDSAVWDRLETARGKVAQLFDPA